MGRVVGLSWICSTLGKFRNRTFGSSLLNFLAIRTNSLRSCRSYANPLEPRQTPSVVGSPILINSHNKIPDNKSHRYFYGASNGTELEKYCIEFAQMCLHETEVISGIEKIYLP